MDKTKQRDLCIGIAAVAFVNFLVFALITGFLGGTAAAGTVRNGHYFLGEKARLVEVSRGVYWLSLVHVWVVAVTTVAGLIAFARGRAVQQDLQSSRGDDW